MKRETCPNCGKTYFLGRWSREHKCKGKVPASVSGLTTQHQTSEPVNPLTDAMLMGDLSNRPRFPMVEKDVEPAPQVEDEKPKDWSADNSSALSYGSSVSRNDAYAAPSDTNSGNDSGDSGSLGGGE